MKKDTHFITPIFSFRVFLILLISLLLIFSAANVSLASTDRGRSPIQLSSEALTEENSSERRTSLSVDKTSYEKGEEIRIRGKLRGENKSLIENGKVNLMLSYNEWNRKLEARTEGDNFLIEYQISHGDPSGMWTVCLMDENWENAGLKSRELKVIMPKGIAYYTTQFRSPPAEYCYRRGENIDISVQVVEAGKPVENALVSVYSPSGKRINLKEGNPGKYSTTYVPSWDAPRGKWCLTVEAIKISEESLKVGGSYIPVEIEPTDLKLELLSPDELSVIAQDSMRFRIRATYLDGSPLDNASLDVSVGDENLNLVYLENGVYRGRYVPDSDDLGGRIVEIKAIDSYGNRGNREYILQVRSPPSGLDLSLIVIISACLVIVGVGSYLVWRSHFRMGLEDVKDEIAQIRELQTKTAERYFKDGSISRGTYDSTMGELSDRLSELRQMKEKLEEKS